MSDDELVSLLERLPARVSAIVMHPDAMVDLAPYRRLGRRLCVENMDPRKALGQTAAELERYFEALPEARFCFDVAHAKAVDESLAVARELLSRYSARLSHVHLSSLDAEQHHVPLTDADQEAFAAVLRPLQRRAVDPGSAADLDEARAGGRPAALRGRRRRLRTPSARPASSPSSAAPPSRTCSRASGRSTGSRPACSGRGRAAS